MQWSRWELSSRPWSAARCLSLERCIRRKTVSRYRPASRARGKSTDELESSTEIERDIIPGKTGDASLESEWDWFKWEAYNQKFEATWNGASVVLGMSAWLVSSIAVAFLLIPQTINFFSVASFKDLTPSMQSTFLLIIQALETSVGLGVIYTASGRWNQSPSSELFKFSLSKPFEKRYGWLIWASIGIGCSIASNVLLSTVLYFSGLEAIHHVDHFSSCSFVQISSGVRTVDSVAGMLTADPYSYLKLLTVVGILAPLLEETVFRGFLLPSLMKWMPSYQAVVVSSLFFGCAHLSVRDLPYLTVVGAIWGFAYIRSRNLATPMVLHCLWNSTVLSVLYLLLSMGIDLKQLLS